MSESNSKLFILAIGGTGVRVLRSLMMLLASGAKLPNTSEVIPIVIDSDLANGNWISTKLVMDKYKKIRDEIKDIDESKFFYTKLSGLNDILQTQSDKTKEYFKIQLDNTENTEFQKFIDYPNLDDNNKALIDLLFSKDNLEINMSEGFYGNPNVGSVVFTQLQDSKEFQLFLDRFSKGDRVFFISSLFGGTGASGFPTIVKLIQDSKNEYVKNTKIGSICVQPYFGLTQEDSSKINSEVFLAKTKAAMEYTKGIGVHANYFIGDEDSRSSSKYENNPGSAGQNNKAHYIELCSALSIFDFMEKSDFELSSPSNYYYGIYESDKSKPYSLKNFSDKSYKYLKNLINYSFFIIYLNNKKNDFLSNLTTWNQNSDKGGMLNKDFFNTIFYYNLESFNSEFLLWLCELNLNNQSFSILNKCFDDVNLFSSDREETVIRLRKRIKDFVTKKNILELPGLELRTRNIKEKISHLIDSDPYDKLTKELNTVTSDIKNVQSITSLPQKFIYLFGLSIDKWINQYFSEFDSTREKNSSPKILNYHLPSYKDKHWYNINQTVDTGIILDPDQTKINKEITSIPSPFARIKLCESSFSYIKNSPEGETPYHKLVSDCLDVWITVFYQNRFQDEITIKEWYKGDNNNPGDLGKLLSSKNPSHKLLGKTLKLFLDTEKDLKNWNQFFIVFDGKKVIGGTSPLTIFFPTANREGISRTFGHDTTFDSSYCSLNNREKDFKEYIYRFRDYLKENSISSENFSKLSDYIDKNSSDVLYEDGTGNKFYNNSKYYEPVKLSGGKSVKLHNLTEVRKKYIDNSLQSDFFILPSYEKDRKILPLVLGEFYPSQEMHYINASWNHPTIPSYDEKPLEERKLPGEGVKYPYLTISDFLEPYLIELDFPINDEYFYNALRDSQSKNNGYLLPLKPIFFEYFTSTDLAKGHLKKDSNRFIEIHKLAGDGVEVTLRIPIQKNEYIEFKRIYFEGETTQPSEKDNRGKLIKSKFSVNLSPPLKSCPNPNYRIMLINVESNDRKKYSLSFFNKEEEINEKSNKIFSSIRSEDPGNFITEYYSLKSEFDYIRVFKEYPDCSGILIPVLNDYKNLDKVFKFSIDFGTSNTHIEVKEGDKEEIPFTITKKDLQIATLHKNDSDLHNSEIIDFINIEFFPRLIDGSEKYHFPTRTVLGEKPNINFFSNNLKGLVVSNIPFGYGKERMLEKFINIQTNLKWVTSGDDQEKSKFNKRIELYFEELLFLIRNKILLNGGNLEKTQLIWFYPYSMDQYTRENTFSLTWDKWYKEYINSSGSTHYYSESIAPYYYYLNKNGSQGSVVVSVDIGGGTTDLAFYLDRKPIFLSSVRFASNNLFGSGFGNSSGENNGFISKHKEKIFSILSDSKLKDLRAELELSLKRTSYEGISTLFSMENAKEIRESSLKFSFSEMLQDDSKFRLVFLMYYTSILYHISKILKMKNIDPPKNIIFTGMGSKVLNLIVRNDKTLEDYSKNFIENYLEKPYGERRFEILINKINPKEATSKGGLYMTSEEIPSDIDDFKFVLLGSSRDEFISEKDNAKRYSNITIHEKNEIVNETMNFIKIFYDFGNKYFEKKFGITDHDFINKSKKLLLNKDEILDFINEGENRIKKELGDSNNKIIVESYFFYPITGLINLLVKSIASGELK